MASAGQLARAHHSRGAHRRGSVVRTDAPAVYRVVSGDSLERIAHSFDLTVPTLIAANPRLRSHPNRLAVGTVLNIPCKDCLYDVQPGDTLADVAKRLQVSEDDLVEFNALTVHKGEPLKAGTHLQIPPPHARGIGLQPPSPKTPPPPARTQEPRMPSPAPIPQQPEPRVDQVALPAQPAAEDWPAAKPSTVGPTSYTVELVQRALNRLGYSLADDASMGSGTKAAVKAFQKANKLKQTGVVDQATWNALRAKSSVAQLNATFQVSRSDLAGDSALQNAFDVIATLAYEDPQRLRALLLEVGASQTTMQSAIIIDRQACWALAERCKAMGIPLTQTTTDAMQAFDHDGSGMRGYDEARSVADFIVQDMPAAHRINTDTYDDTIRKAVAHSNGRHPKQTMPGEMAKTVIAIESSFDPKSGSKAGAAGLMQLMPAAAKAYGVKNRFDPAQNILGGTTMIGDLYADADGSAFEAFARYNSGGTDYHILETRNYIRRAQTIYAYYRVTHPLDKPAQAVDPATTAAPPEATVPADPQLDAAQGQLTQSFPPGDSN